MAWCKDVGDRSDTRLLDQSEEILQQSASKLGGKRRAKQGAKPNLPFRTKNAMALRVVVFYSEKN